MPVKEILPLEHELLGRRANPVRVTQIKNQQTQDVIKSLVATLKQTNTQTLSCPQIGILSRIIAFKFNPKKLSSTKKDEFFVCVNPVIIDASPDKKISKENCASYKSGKKTLKIPRHIKIEVIGFSSQGKKVSFVAEHPWSGYIEHAIDHLEGKSPVKKAK